MTETYIPVARGSYDVETRIEAAGQASDLGCGLHMAVGNSMTRYYADSEVPIGNVKITMPLTYKGFPEYIKTLGHPADEWCPRETEPGHAVDSACLWCGTERRSSQGES